MMLLAVSFFVYFAIGFGVTLGYHRWLSHRSFEAPKALCYLLVLFGLPSGTPLQWAGQHRAHHRWTDKLGDPHSPEIFGLAGAHVGWYIQSNSKILQILYAFAGPLRILFDSVWRPRHWDPSWKSLCPDVTQDEFLMKLSKPLNYFILMLFYFSILGLMFYFAAGILGLLTWYLLTVVLYNLGDAASSISHVYGMRFPHSKNRATNIAWMALLNGGEAWHANHHRFPASARLGFGWQIDFGYLFLLVLKRLGLVKQIKQPTQQELAIAYCAPDGLKTI